MLGGVIYDDSSGEYTYVGLNKIGIACVKYNGVCYWVQEFARSSNTSSETTVNDAETKVSVSVPSDSITVSVDTADCTMTENAKEKLPEVTVTCKGTRGDVVLDAPTVDWTSSDAGVVDISDGVMVAVSAGSATVSAIINGEEYSVEVTVNHNCTHYDGVDATCTASGTIEYWYCTECGSYFSDEACTTEIKVADITIDALGHVWGDVVWSEWTETADGSYTISASHTCSRCTETEELTPEITAESEDATCTKAGTVTYSAKVTVDGIEMEAEPKVIEGVPLGHEYDEGVVTKEPTCTEDGEMTYTCSRGDYSYTESIEKLGHDYDDGVVTKEPTCTEDGEMTYTCSRGDDSYTESIYALGHDWTVEQTIIEDSEDKYEEKVGLICTRCGLEYAEEIVITNEGTNGVAAHSSLSWNDLISAKELADLFEAGAEFDFKLTAEMYEEGDVPTEDKNLAEDKIEELWAGYDYTVSYLGIDVLMDIIHADGTEEIQKFEETLNPVTISVTIPDELAAADGDTYAVIRIHDGAAEMLDTTADDGTLTFSTDKFSTYALVKISSSEEEGLDDGTTGNDAKANDAKATEDSTKKNSADEASGTGLLLLKGKAKKKSVTLTWNKVKNADGYIIYGARCGKDLKKVATVKGNSTTTKTIKKLKKSALYKYKVKAYKVVDGKRKVLLKSNMVHVVTKGTAYTTVKSVKASTKAVTLKVGKTKKVKAAYKKVNPSKELRKHTDYIRFISSDTSVATVKDNGKITAVEKGTCKVYAYAANGKRCKIKVTVK